MLWAYRAYLDPTFPTSKSLESLRWVYRAYLEPTLPTRKPSEYIALSPPSPPRAYLANQQLFDMNSFEPTRTTSSLPCRQPANEPSEPTSILSCQWADHRNTVLWAYGTYLKPILPTANPSKTLLWNVCYAFFVMQSSQTRLSFWKTVTHG